MPGGLTRIRIAPGEPPAAVWREALEDPHWAQRAVTLKEEGDDWVRRGTLRIGGQTREVVVKRRRARGPVEALKALAGHGRLLRQWRGASWLASRGIPTARPLALVQRIGPLGAEEILATEALSGRSLLEHLAQHDLPPKRRRILAAAAGRLAARIALGGRFNRDHKPSNLIVTRLTDADAEIAVIDTVAIRLGYTDLWGLERMLASMVIEPIGCGCAPHPRELRVAVRAAAAEVVRERKRPSSLVPVLAWYLWRAAATIIEAHGDPTPRVNPLGSPAPASGPEAGKGGGSGWHGGGGLLGSRR